MLIVTIAIWPDGDRSRAQTLTRAAIGNLSDLADRSDYVAVIRGAGEAPHSFLVRGHRRADGPWELVRRVAETYDDPEVEIVPPEYGRLVELAVTKLDDSEATT